MNVPLTDLIEQAVSRKRQQEFGEFAIEAAQCLAAMDVVEQVGIFGSVGRFLNDEQPKNERYKWFKDIDIAIFSGPEGFSCDAAGSFFRFAVDCARHRGMRIRLDEQNIELDVFVFSNCTGKYLGRLLPTESCGEIVECTYRLQDTVIVEGALDFPSYYSI